MALDAMQSSLNIIIPIVPSYPVQRVKVDSTFDNKQSKAPPPAATTQIARCLLPGGHALAAFERSNIRSANQITANDAKNKMITIRISGVADTAVTTAATLTVAIRALFGVESIIFPVKCLKCCDPVKFSRCAARRFSSRPAPGGAPENPAVAGRNVAA